MKDLVTALEEEVERTGIPKNEISELILDDKCRTTHLIGLEDFSSLRKLSLCNVGLSTLTGFPPLQNLTKLILSDNRIPDGLENLSQAGLTNLKVLSLASNRISDISQLEPLRQLELLSLDLCQCPLVQTTTNYRESVLEMLPSLRILDNIDREGIELLDDDNDDEEEEEDSSSEYEESEGGPDEEGDVRMEDETYNLVTSSEDGEEQSVQEEEEPEEIHISVLAGPTIVDGRSDDDQDYTAPDVESETEDCSLESDDDDTSISHHFSTEEGPPAAGPSQPTSIGGKRKRGPQDRPDDVPQDEDYEDL